MTTDASTQKQCLHITPVLKTPNVLQAVRYYEQILGFTKCLDYREPVFYAGVSRDGVDIHFSQCPETAAAPERQAMDVDVYVTVSDVDSLFAELLGRGANVVHGLTNHECGTREFHVEDCCGYWLGFGQRI